MQDRIWAYLIHLGYNMWGDKGSEYPTPYFGNIEFREKLPVYHERMRTDRAVWKNTVDFCASSGVNTLVIDLGEGVQYESHPELAIPGAWTKDELKAELDRLRGLGITPIPKMNFSACHDVWLGEYRLMRCTQKYYQVCGELIDEVCELFGHPKLFHIGMDEEDSNCQNFMMSKFVRYRELWWHDFNFFVAACERNGARAWCWSDQYWVHPDEFTERMSKEVVQSNWAYHDIPLKGKDGKYPDTAYQSYIDFGNMGFDQIPTASGWGYVHNIEQTVLMCKAEIADQSHLIGFMAAPWLQTIETNRYGLMDNAHRLGIARKQFES